MNIKQILYGNSCIDIIELFYLIKEMPRKKKKQAQKLFEKYSPGGYDDIKNYNET